MLMMTGLIFSISALIIITVGMAAYNFFVKKKTIEHYYTPVDHIFGQTPVVHHEEKVEKKEREEEEGDDKDKNSKKGKNSSAQICRNR